jgi:hypothetical protein
LDEEADWFSLAKLMSYRFLLYGGAVLALVLAAHLAGERVLFPLDDAYITLHNARILLSGAPDPVYGSSYLTGATSPVHLLLVALVGLVLPPVWASLLIGVVGAALYIAALRRLGADLAGWERPAFVFVGAAWGYSLFNYLNGLETSVAMATSAWLMLWCDDRRKLPILGGIAPFIRPELAILSGLLMLRLSWHLRRSPRSLLACLGTAGAVALPWAAWVFIETGQIIPSTMGAKLVFFRESILPLGTKLRMLAGALAQSMQLPLYLGMIGLLRVRAGWAGALFILLVAAVSLAIMPSALNWNYARYQEVFTPVLMAGLAGILIERSRTSGILLGALVVGAVATAGFAIRDYASEINYAQKVAAQGRFVAKLPASSVVLIHDAGRVAWENPNARLIDIVGLKTPEVVSLHKEMSAVPCGSPQSLDSIARRYHATHLVVLERWNFTCIAQNLRVAGWRLSPIYDDYYTVYQLSAPSR